MGKEALNKVVHMSLKLAACPTHPVTSSLDTALLLTLIEQISTE